jgi:cytochrome c-type biogenesis protein CcmH/NrfG
MARLSSASQARRARIDGYARQAEAARRSGSYVGLQASCQRWTQDQPGNGEAWRCLGLAQFQTGAGRDALPALRQALKLEPRDAQVESAILSILRP